MLKDSLKEFVVFWNNEFPLDRWWRLKYKVSFGSEAHLQMNQAAIFLEYLEELTFVEHANSSTDKEKKKKSLEEGEWISENVSDEDFDKIVI